jgi:alkyl hydroperoxide reductase subunit AhpC
MRSVLTGVSAAMVAMALFVSPAAAEQQEKAQLGQKAPDFTLQDHEGNEVSLSDYEGQIVVLEWINDGCPFVVKFYRPGKMQEWQQKYGEQDVKWLIIASSSPGTQGYHTADGWQKIAGEWNIEVPILLDPDGQVGRKYEARVTPHMYIINKEGALVYRGGIDSIRSANSADIDRADQYVVNALDELLADESVSVAETQAYGCTVKYAN